MDDPLVRASQVRPTRPDTPRSSNSNQLHSQTYTLTFENTALGVSSQTSSCSPSCGSTVTTYYTRDTRGALISQRSPSGASATEYYLFDGNGSVVGLTDTSGTLVATYAYDPYGNVVSSGGGGTWGFQSGYNEGSGVGLIKFGARYDDPTLGRWTQQDPVGGSLGDTGATDRYVCVRDDPVNVSDLSGRSPGGTIGACLKGAFVGFVGLYAAAITLALVPPATPIVLPTLAAVGVAVVVGCVSGTLIYNFSNLVDSIFGT